MLSRTGPLAAVQLLAAPLTFQVSAPVGAPLLDVPVTMAVKVSGMPTVVGDGATRVMDGAVLAILIATAVVVALR